MPEAHRIPSTVWMGERAELIDKAALLRRQEQILDIEQRRRRSREATIRPLILDKPNLDESRPGFAAKKQGIGREPIRPRPSWGMRARLTAKRESRAPGVAISACRQTSGLSISPC